MAAVLLVPAAYAQYAGHEKYAETNMVGYNKYLLSDTPTNGEYTLRLETFVTGSVSKTAIPTDFVLVLDCSGSMLFDCLYGVTRPESISKAENDASHYLRAASPAFDGLDHYSYESVYRAGNGGQQMDGSGNGHTIWHAFEEGLGSGPSLYYYHSGDKMYYKIHRETWSSGHYRLYFTRSNGAKTYIYSDSSNVQHVSATSPTAGGANNNKEDILLVGYAGDNLYRPISRREALIDAVDAFIDEIAHHNANDNWTAGVTKNQVSIVAFGNGYTSGNASNINESTDTGSGTRVVKKFREINSSTATDYKNALSQYFGFRANTYIHYGMHLATLLLQDLQGKTGMNPLNTHNGVNRNKVVIVFTDGSPTGTGGGVGYTVKQSLNEANTIKTKRTVYTGSQINGQVYSIDLANVAGAPAFLQHLSSNYLTSSTTTNDSAEIANIRYSGTQVANNYYMDANAGGLTDIFVGIAKANTGNFSSRLVTVDVLSDSFKFPAGLASADKVKLYTAQCIGKKTIDGHDYLAFAQPIPIKDRPALDHLWVNTGVDAHDEPIWVDRGLGDDGQPIDIDANIDYYIVNETKSIVFTGFDFADLWCGLDEDTDHNNTRTPVASNDPNASYALPGYRGFKLIAEFPIQVEDDALGGLDVPTNVFSLSGLFNSTEDNKPTGDAIINYQKPALPIPIKLIIQKTGLAKGESASFTIERKLIGSTEDYTEFTTFFLTGTGTDAKPEIRFINLDPSYYYRVKETGWSWAYQNAGASYMPSTETQDPRLGNPIVFTNTPKTDVPKRGEAKAVNKMRSTGSTTETVYD